MYGIRTPDPRYQAPNQALPIRHNYPPGGNQQIHNGYSDGEKPFNAPDVPASGTYLEPSGKVDRRPRTGMPRDRQAAMRPTSHTHTVPSPPRSRSRQRSPTPERHSRRSSSRQRVPSPGRLPPTATQYQRDLSSLPLTNKPTKSSRRNALTPGSQPPSYPPPVRRGLSPIDTLNKSGPGKNNTEPGHHTVPSTPGQYGAALVLPKAVLSSEFTRPDGVKRSFSERVASRNVSTPEPPLRSLPSSAKRPASLALSSSFRSSVISSPGILRDQGYQYRELKDLEFRLVRIFPERKTMIKCQIIHASLEGPPTYVAISYAWGDAGNTRKIELEGSLVPISVSLYGALDAVRKKLESVLVWVDALCIDQSNRDERTQQVQLMTSIYSTADSVAIWLGPEEDDSKMAADLLREVADQALYPEKVSRLLSSRVGQRDLAGVVSLFERDYWKRLWVVQEIFNARSITVYCGSSKLPWSVYQKASETFSRHRTELDVYFPGGQRNGRRTTIAPTQFSYSQVLVYQGPGSLPNLKSYMGLGQDSLLEVLRACRRKLASDPKDKLFAVLGALPEETRMEFRADYSLSVKDVYTEVVDYLLKTTESLDVICDAIHFPVHTGSANLPSYVPDWSHIPQTAAMGHKYNFTASADMKADCRFLDERLNKLELYAIYLDKISFHGMAVGTLCTLGDYLMAFLHWRALLLGTLESESEEASLMIQDDFCKTLSLGQVPPPWNKENQWRTVCYYVFASLLRERLPHMSLDRMLASCANAKLDVVIDNRRQFLQKHFGDQMMGRCFCRTGEGRLGMGSGFMLPGDIVVVPMGCSTPVLLRQEGARGEYRFVGDVYIHGFMHGRAVDEFRNGNRKLVNELVTMSSSEANSPLYTYQSLTAPNTIRLINILPSKVSNIDRNLVCTFSVVSLADKPDFVALSYTWGDNAFTETLVCREGILRITKNLHAALVQFRPSDRPLIVWADAVCINQSDDAEKSLQIPLMADIYSQATEVIIWLGEETEGSRDAMLYLKRIGQKFLDRGEETLKPRDERSPENDALWKDLVEDPNVAKTDLIWTRPWFSRVWIIQELSLATRATAHCGDVSMDWDVLFAACKAIGRAASDGGLFWDQALKRPRSFRATTSLNVWKLDDMRDSIRRQGIVSNDQILGFLDSARSFHCRDAKDKIVGLSSIFNRGKEVPFNIQYEKHEAEIFIDFARWNLSHSDIVDILSFAGLANHSLIPDSLSLPSWVPDWRLPYRLPTDTLGGFTAGHKLSSMVEVDDSSRQLLVKGMLVDKVIALVLESDAFKEIGQHHVSSYLDPAHLPKWYIQIELVVNQVMKTQWGSDEEYIGGGKLWDALARTLIIDRNDPVFNYIQDRPQAVSPDDHVAPPHSYFTRFRAHMLSSLKPPAQQESGSFPPLTIMPYESMEYHSRVAAITSDRCFFITSLGYIGLGPKGLRPSDVICVPTGASVPYILRPLNPAFNLYWQGAEPARNAYVQLPNGEGLLPYILRKEEETYSLIGECYAHGLMRGEVWHARGIFFEDFSIV